MGRRSGPGGGSSPPPGRPLPPASAPFQRSGTALVTAPLQSSPAPRSFPGMKSHSPPRETCPERAGTMAPRSSPPATGTGQPSSPLASAAAGRVEDARTRPRARPTTMPADRPFFLITGDAPGCSRRTAPQDYSTPRVAQERAGRKAASPDPAMPSGPVQARRGSRGQDASGGHGWHSHACRSACR